MQPSSPEIELRLLEASEALLKSAEELTNIGSFRWNPEADEVCWSDGLHRIFGVEKGDFEGTLEGYLERLHPEEREARSRAISELIESGDQIRSEHRIVRPDGEVRWIESAIRAVRDGTGQMIELVGACQDITERRQERQALELEMEMANARALEDPVTRLANRNLALDRLNHAFDLAKRREAGIAVLFVDLDGFKVVNDRFGHAAGDKVLASAGERLKGAVRRCDTVARLGGDEFLVICEGAQSGEAALDTADRVQRSFDQPFDCEGTEQALTVSVGVSILGDRDVATAHELVDEADQAMYEAKRRGPGESALFQPEAADPAGPAGD